MEKDIAEIEGKKYFNLREKQVSIILDMQGREGVEKRLPRLEVRGRQPTSSEAEIPNPCRAVSRCGHQANVSGRT